MGRGLFFRDCLQGRPADPKPLTKNGIIDKSDVPRDSVIVDAVAAAFCVIFRHIKPLLAIPAPMESPFKELSNAPLIVS